MGELHLEIYVERIRREYKVDVEVGAPKVSYREAPTRAAEFNFSTRSRPAAPASTPTSSARSSLLPEDAEETFVFEEKVVGGRIPKQYIPSVEKGFRSGMRQGPGGRLPGRRPARRSGRRLVPRGRQLGHGLPDLRRRLLSRDASQDEAGAARTDHEDRDRSARATSRARWTGDLTSRRGHDHRHRDRSAPIARIEAEVPLAETFGYSTDLRSMTQGQGTFTMEFARYRRVPAAIQETILAEKKAERDKKQLVGAK